MAGWMPEGWVEIGRVERALGLDGSMLVSVSGEDSQLLSASEATLRGEPGTVPFRVLSARARPGAPARIELRLAGITTRELAEDWAGASLSIQRSALAALPEGEHYSAELVGLEVRSLSGRSLGRVKEIWPSPAHDLLVVETGGEPVLVPAVPPILQRVEVALGEIWIDPPAGLFPEEGLP